MQGALVMELRSHMPHGKKIKIKNKDIFKTTIIEFNNTFILIVIVFKVT